MAAKSSMLSSPVRYNSSMTVNKGDPEAMESIVQPILDALPDSLPPAQRFVIAIAGPPASGWTRTQRSTRRSRARSGRSREVPPRRAWRSIGRRRRWRRSARGGDAGASVRAGQRECRRSQYVRGECHPRLAGHIVGMDRFSSGPKLARTNPLYWDGFPKAVFPETKT